MCKIFPLYDGSPVHYAPTGLTRSLNSRPAAICEPCWQGPFAAQLGLFSRLVDSGTGPGGYTYTTTWAAVISRASEGCRWCQFLLGARREDEDPRSNVPIDIVVGKNCISRFVAIINDEQRFEGILATSAGAFLNSTSRVSP